MEDNVESMKSFVLGILFTANIVGFTLLYLRIKRISSALKTLSIGGRK